MTRKPKSPDLEYLFHPRSIAIVGASANPASKGYDYLGGVQELEFNGALYPVNPKADEILGLKAYPSIRDIPGPVDYVISCIAAQPSLQLVGDCATKGTKAVQLYTAGFSETGEAEGKALEAELVRIARRSGIRVIGPNCMGLHYPRGGLAIGRARFSRKGGTVGCLVQSGGHAWNLISSGSLRGIGFSKVISFGNACDLNESDFLEYLAGDPETEVIAAYIEGVKDGSRFKKVVKEAAKAKPVIMFKGGRTEAGMRAVSSHTGSLAGAELIWEAFFQQIGAVQVYSLEDLIDTILPFVYFPSAQGRRVGIVGAGGGASVEAADACESAGLVVPSFPTELREKLKEFTPLAGSSLGNPVDTVEMWNAQNFMHSLELVSVWKGIDFLIVHAVIEMTAQWQGQSVLEGIVDSLLTAGREFNKPIAVVLHTYGTSRGMTTLYDIRKRFISARIPVYPSTSRAAAAISRFIEYQETHR